MSAPVPASSPRAGVHPKTPRPPLRSPLVEPSAFYDALDEAALGDAPYGLIRMAMRDLGDDLLREAIRAGLDSGLIPSASELAVGSFVVLVRPATTGRLHFVASLLAEGVERLAAREGIHVHLVATGCMGTAPAQRALAAVDAGFEFALRESYQLPGTPLH